MATAARIPNIFQHSIECGDDSWGLLPFSYCEIDRTFRIYGKTVSEKSFDPLAFNPYAIGLDEGINLRDINHYSVYLLAGGLTIVSPKLDRWIQQNPDNRYSAIDVMKNVYFESEEFKLLDVDLDELDIDDGPPGHIGFNASLRNHGGFVLQVIGNCACLSPDPHGIFEDQFEVGFAEYSLHNADTRAQRTALYAGLGHLAFKANDESPAQLKLF